MFANPLTVLPHLTAGGLALFWCVLIAMNLALPQLQEKPNAPGTRQKGLGTAHGAQATTPLATIKKYHFKM